MIPCMRTMKYILLHNAENMACTNVLSSPQKPEIIQVPQVTDAKVVMKKRYDETTVLGILVDSECSQLCTGEIAQYIWFCKQNGFILLLAPRPSLSPLNTDGRTERFVLSCCISHLFCLFKTWTDWVSIQIIYQTASFRRNLRLRKG